MSISERITIHDLAGEVRVSYGDIMLARSRSALRLDEKGHQSVFYIPAGDVSLARLTRSQSHSHCPYKGDASYYSLTTDDGTVPDVAWYYPQPIDAVTRIANHVAFYRDKCAVTLTA